MKWAHVHVQDAYKLIVENFGTRTRILLFGLSRGAFTIRCVNGAHHAGCWVFVSPIHPPLMATLLGLWT